MKKSNDERIQGYQDRIGQYRIGLKVVLKEGGVPYPVKLDEALDRGEITLNNLDVNSEHLSESEISSRLDDIDQCLGNVGQRFLEMQDIVVQIQKIENGMTV